MPDIDHPRVDEELMNTREALAYLGLYNNLASELGPHHPDNPVAIQHAIEELEEIVVDEEIDVELDDENDRIVGLDRAQLAGALFRKHEREVGHRPDNPDRMREERAKIEREKKDKQERLRKTERSRLVRRVKKRQAARRADASR